MLVMFRILAVVFLVMGRAIAQVGELVEISYWVDPCPPVESACRATDRELAEWSIQAWEAAGKGAIRVTKAVSREKALLRFRWVTQKDGLYGEARPILVNGRRGAELFIRPEMDGLGVEIAAAASKDALLRDAIVYLTCLHESGHGLGLPHTSRFEDIMYSFGNGGDIREYFGRYRRKLTAREEIRKHSGMSDADAAALRRLHAPQR